MKVAVLFGSFNPMTNAHVAAMKAAIEHLGADRGLFVCTSGQYLKKKTVKVNDPFYLTEDERRGIVEKVCESEAKLAFWGFELGGIYPNRYKTLCKIKQQNPEAEIYEIQGADKVRSIPKFGNAEEYLNNIRFAVFDRNGINLNQLIDSTPILSEHRDSFVFLPSLDSVAEISSTEVRRRFYAGVDYSDIVPAAAAEVLSKHTPPTFQFPLQSAYGLSLKAAASVKRTPARRSIRKILNCSVIGKMVPPISTSAIIRHSLMTHASISLPMT